MKTKIINPALFNLFLPISIALHFTFPITFIVHAPFKYLGGVLVLLGVAIFFGSLVTFVFPVLLFLILDLIYIPVEEQEMEAVFGTEYIKYKQTVRKWA